MVLVHNDKKKNEGHYVQLRGLFVNY